MLPPFVLLWLIKAKNVNIIAFPSSLYTSNPIKTVSHRIVYPTSLLAYLKIFQMRNNPLLIDHVVQFELLSPMIEVEKIVRSIVISINKEV
jgi:hypothetical protein